MGKIIKKRGTMSSYVIPTPKPTKKLLRNLPTIITRKGTQNSQKGKIGEATRTLEELRRTFYTYMKDSYKV
jgi:hypothetical protein